MDWRVIGASACECACSATGARSNHETWSAVEGVSVINENGSPTTRGSAGGKPRRIPPWRWLVVVLALATTVACGPLGAAGGSSAGQSTAPPASQQSAKVGATVGQLAPGFQVRTLDGLTLTSADLQAQQRPYILYFFASW